MYKDKNLGSGVCQTILTYTVIFKEQIMGLLKIFLYILYCFVAINIAVNTIWQNYFLISGILLPICLGIIIVLHELSHLFCFCLFRFEVKELRIGLLLFNFEKNSKRLTFMNSGIFRGFCTVGKSTKNKVKLIIALVAGGVSGLLTSLTSLALFMLDIIPEGWDYFFNSLFYVGLYSFFATLISPRSSDRKLIKEILKEEIIE